MSLGPFTCARFIEARGFDHQTIPPCPERDNGVGTLLAFLMILSLVLSLVAILRHHHYKRRSIVTSSTSLPSPRSLEQVCIPSSGVPALLKPPARYSSILYGESAPHIAFLESTIIRHSVDQGLSLEDVAAMDDVKCVLRDTLLAPFLVPTLFRGTLVRPPRGLLLFGPPGNGKSHIMKAVANTAHMTFFNVNSAQLIGMWMGESEKMISLLFRMAQFYAPSVIFLDEVDALTPVRGGRTEHEATRRMQSVLFTLMDGLSTSAEAESRQVIVVGTTNCPWAIDPAMRRRLEKRIHVPLPNEAARQSLLQHYTRDLDIITEGEGALDWSAIIQATSGYTGADVVAVCREAAMIRVRELTHGKTNQELRALEASYQATSPALQRPPLRIAHCHFQKAIAVTNSSVAPQDLAQFTEWAERYGASV